MGERIANLRHAAGLSQAELGKLLGVSASAVGMYEQGRREPPLSILVSLCRHFRVSADYLLTGQQEKDRQTFTLSEMLTVCTALLLDQKF